jgi:hypothetical protein
MKKNGSSNNLIIMSKPIEKPPLRLLNQEFSVSYLLGLGFFYIQFNLFIVAFISPYWLESKNVQSLEFTSLGICFVSQ